MPVTRNMVNILEALEVKMGTVDQNLVVVTEGIKQLLQWKNDLEKSTLESVEKGMRNKGKETISEEDEAGETSAPRRRNVAEGEMEPIKAELLPFGGGDPEGWIFQAERYFEFGRVCEQERVEVVVMNLTGEALTWYSWMESRRPLQNWSEFREAMLVRFQSTQEFHPYLEAELQCKPTYTSLLTL